jgi:hypothetical protein
MERLILLQLLFNLVVLADVLYLHRRQTKVPSPSTAPKREPAPRKKSGGVVLTLGLRSTVRAAADTQPAPKLEDGLRDLVAAAERAETVALRPAQGTRQRAAEDLRANLRRLEARLGTRPVRAES